MCADCGARINTTALVSSQNHWKSNKNTHHMTLDKPIN